MKRLCAAVLVLVVILGYIPQARAVDVYASWGDYYHHGQTGVTIPYRLVLPEGYDPGKEYPLVVFFHGAGERGNDNTSQLINGTQKIANHMPDAIILAPQCAENNQWVDTPWANGSYSIDAVPESHEMIAVMDLIQMILGTYSVDRNCVYVVGISMGGYAVWDAMIRHNELFAAGVAVCGSGDPSKAAVLKNTPMFVYHGTNDLVVPVSGSEDMVAAIKRVGGTKVHYTAYEGRGHGVWDMAFSQADLYRQLKKCKLSDRGIVPEVKEEPKVPTNTIPEETVSTVPEETENTVPETTTGTVPETSTVATTVPEFAAGKVLLMAAISSAEVAWNIRSNP